MQDPTRIAPAPPDTTLSGNGSSGASPELPIYQALVQDFSRFESRSNHALESLVQFSSIAFPWRVSLATIRSVESGHRRPAEAETSGELRCNRKPASGVLPPTDRDRQRGSP